MKLKDATTKAEGGARAIGMLLEEVARLDARIREMVEQDLENKEMSLERCFAALREHAKKNQKGGFWGCPVVGIDPENEVVRVVFDFYKIPLEWIGAKSQTLGRDGDGLGEAAPAADDFDLMELI